MGPDDATLRAAALRQWQDYQARTPGTGFAAPAAWLDLPGAYALQDAVAALRAAAGDKLIGYKVGCTGPGTVAQFGMRGPIRGCLFGREVHRSGATIDAAHHANLAIEGEMALRIGPDGDIAEMIPAIELHNFVFRGPRKTLVELVGNNGLNAGLVLGGSAPTPAADAVMTVAINGVVMGRGGLWPLPGGPGASLDWLRGHLAESGQTIAPGMVVLAGTPLGLYPVQAGDVVAVSVDGQAEVGCRVV